jgi:signal transduction histidine kinase
MRILIAEDEPMSRLLLQTHLQKWGYEVTAALNGAEAWRLFQAGSFPLVISDWMMPEIDGPELVKRIRTSQRTGYVYVILLTAKTQKGDVVVGMEAGANDFVTKPFDVDELRVRVRAGERIVRLEQDLAEQNRVLRETQAALVQSEKLAGLGRLAAGIAHEINNPLAYVTNNLTVLRRDMEEALALLNRYRQGWTSLQRVEPQLAEELARAEKEIDLPYFQANFARMCDRSLEGLQRVRDIVMNLRDFARLDEAEFKEVDLNAALRTTIEILGPEVHKKQIRVQTVLQDLPGVLGHPGKINQVFFHLLGNAVQACASGGLIKVRTREEPGKDVIVEIEDNGCGIKSEHMARLFEPFFTTKPVGQGTGLGLSVSFGVIRDHGGTIEVESEEGRGTLFRIRLPVRSRHEVP